MNLRVTPRVVLALLLGFFAIAVPPHRAMAKDTEVPSELTGIDIEDRRGAVIPREVTLRDQDTHPVLVGDYFDGKRPVVLVLAYFDCPMLCSMVINGVLEAMKELRWTAGAEYRVLVVSFDPRDTSAAALAKQKNYAASYGRPLAARAFDFDVGDKAEVRRLASAVGFNYRWDEDSKQFAHAAGAFVITPDGRLSRTLFGLNFPDLKLALLEASEGRIGTTIERALLFCYHYDPNAKGYVLATTRIVRASGLITMLALGTWLFGFWRGERRRKARPTPVDLPPPRTKPEAQHS